MTASPPTPIGETPPAPLHQDRPSYFLTRWLFLRAMGVVYLVAFASLGMQILGLVGSHGILPAHDFLINNHQAFGASAYWQIPTLCWISSGDGFLQFLCWGGVALAVLLILGVAPVPVAVLLWVFYLSLVSVGQDFLEFQWDNLLLETGLLTIFLAPVQWLPPRKLSTQTGPPIVVIWLIRWLLFRLMFLSGMVKLTSGDKTWRNLTALDFHYFTQPLPTWLAWHAQAMPEWSHRASLGAMFVIEIVVPFLIFGPRLGRLIACFLLILLQIVISLTGNYCFFNLLTAILCLTLLDDRFLRNLLPRRWSKKLASLGPGAPPRWPRSRKWILGVLCAVVIPISLATMAGEFWGYDWMPTPVWSGFIAVGRLRSINGYGLFRVMTTHRYEIILEGSNDLTTWKAYEFNWKPGDVTHRPAFVAPHQPRLDWQMWFAALGTYQSNPWTINLVQRLLEGSPDVLALLKLNPFPDKPPKWVRAKLYEYHFTNPAAERSTGAWWSREEIGDYLTPLSLRTE